MKTQQTQENKKDLLILVDESDQELGFKSKSECHQGDGTLHRAFPFLSLTLQENYSFKGGVAIKHYGIFIGPIAVAAIPTKMNRWSWLLKDA